MILRQACGWDSSQRVEPGARAGEQREEGELVDDALVERGRLQEGDERLVRERVELREARGGMRQHLRREDVRAFVGQHLFEAVGEQAVRQAVVHAPDDAHRTRTRRRSRWRSAARHTASTSSRACGSAGRGAARRPASSRPSPAALLRAARTCGSSAACAVRAPRRRRDGRGSSRASSRCGPHRDMQSWSGSGRAEPSTTTRRAARAARSRWRRV